MDSSVRTASFLVCLFVIAMTISCITSHVIPLGVEHKYAVRIAPDSIQVFLERPDRPHEQIALVEAEGAALSSKGDALALIKKKASALGGDAIIYSPTSREFATGLFGSSTHKITKAIVIRFRDDDKSAMKDTLIDTLSRPNVEIKGEVK